jgi:hypothetical protein
MSRPQTSSESLDLEIRFSCMITAANYTEEDLAFCFKLTVWDLQCKYADLVDKYVNKLKFGENCKDLFVTLKTFKRGLEVLNNYNVLDLDADTEEYNIEIFLSKEDNQFYYLDRNRKPVKLIPETNIITDNTTITGSGTEEDPLVVTGGSGASVPELNFRAVFGLAIEAVLVNDTFGVTGLNFIRGGVGNYQITWNEQIAEPQKMQIIFGGNQQGIAYPTIYSASGISFKVSDFSGAPLDMSLNMEVQLKYYGS